MDLLGLKHYVMDRARENSTWQGIVLILAATGHHLAPEMQTVIVTVGLGAAGLIGALFPDRAK